MIWLNIRSPHGIEAEFHVDSATMALDLALRSGRAGLSWRAECRAEEPAVPLTLEALRVRATSAARLSDAERRVLDEVEWQHQVQVGFSLN
jgi:hypothetical protein